MPPQEAEDISHLFSHFHDSFLENILIVGIHFFIILQIPLSQFRSLISQLNLSILSILFLLLDLLFILPHIHTCFKPFFGGRLARVSPILVSALPMFPNSRNISFLVFLFGTFLLLRRVYLLSIHFCVTLFFLFLFTVYFCLSLVFLCIAFVHIILIFTVAACIIHAFRNLFLNDPFDHTHNIPVAFPLVPQLYFLQLLKLT